MLKTAINLLISLSLSPLIKLTYTKTVDESSTGTLLTFPSVIDGPLYNKSFAVAPAQFGYQQYGGKLEGVLILPKNVTYHKECPSTPLTPEGNEPLGQNTYIHYIQDGFNISDNDIRNYILVIDRLDCEMVDKILHAQEMGASGVIMCDWRDESLFTMQLPQGVHDWTSIDIPSVLLDNHNCHTLMQHIGVQNWDPNTPQNMSYPTVESMNWTIATIEWGLPHPDDRVEYELWTSSNDYLGSRFKHNFNTTAIQLDQANDTQFTPHMYVLNGSHWGCDTIINGTWYAGCKQQCSNSGRYCAVDPEYDTSIGLDGMDVIQENLRSLCVWEYDKERVGGGDDIMWWDYAVLWDENCGVYSNSSLNFNEDCSFAQMDKLTNNHVLKNYVKQKIADTGGYAYDSGDNSILARETKLKYNSSIYAVPMIRVNEFLIHGNIDCEPPITVQSCEVLAAICAGFIENEPKPDVCYATPAPTIATCTETERDCEGTCFGNALVDACDQCLLVSSHEWNECIGCNGLKDTEFDCAGTCGGYYDVNPCGYCKDKRHASWATFGVDCQGGCNIDLKTDECGQCITESDLNWNVCIGCDGIAHSDKRFNECGSCVLATDANFDEYGKDCRGLCSSSVTDTHYVDECGICLLPSDASWNNCFLTQNTSTAAGTTNNPTAEPTMERSIECANYEFKCDNKCILSSWVCDSMFDCDDHSDEMNCDRDCGPNQFQCANSICIPANYTCDLYDDCGDNSDEYNCTKPTSTTTSTTASTTTSTSTTSANRSDSFGYDGSSRVPKLSCDGIAYNLFGFTVQEPAGVCNEKEGSMLRCASDGNIKAVMYQNSDCSGEIVKETRSYQDLLLSNGAINSSVTCNSGNVCRYGIIKRYNWTECDDGNVYTDMSVNSEFNFAKIIGECNGIPGALMNKFVSCNDGKLTHNVYMQSETCDSNAVTQTISSGQCLEGNKIEIVCGTAIDTTSDGIGTTSDGTNSVTLIINVSGGGIGFCILVCIILCCVRRRRIKYNMLENFVEFTAPVIKIEGAVQTTTS